MIRSARSDADQERPRPVAGTGTGEVERAGVGDSEVVARVPVGAGRVVLPGRIGDPEHGPGGGRRVDGRGQAR